MNFSNCTHAVYLIHYGFLYLMTVVGQTIDGRIRHKWVPLIILCHPGASSWTYQQSWGSTTDLQFSCVSLSSCCKVANQPWQMINQHALAYVSQPPREVAWIPSEPLKPMKVDAICSDAVLNAVNNWLTIQLCFTVRLLQSCQSTLADDQSTCTCICSIPGKLHELLWSQWKLMQFAQMQSWMFSALKIVGVLLSIQIGLWLEQIGASSHESSLMTICRAWRNGKVCKPTSATFPLPHLQNEPVTTSFS
jgi:hypothetical protein